MELAAVLVGVFLVLAVAFAIGYRNVALEENRKARAEVERLQNELSELQTETARLQRLRAILRSGEWRRNA